MVPCVLEKMLVSTIPAGDFEERSVVPPATKAAPSSAEMLESWPSTISHFAAHP